MVSSVSSTDSVFEEDKISTSVSVDESPAFFREHGIFYQAAAAIGTLISEGGNPDVNLERFKGVLHDDPRAKRILEPFSNRPALFFAIGSDPGHFFASTVKDNQDDRPVLYIWGPESRLEFFDRSYIESKGVWAANGLMEIPYPFLRKKYGKEIKIRMEEGGYMIVHPRLAYHVTAQKKKKEGSSEKEESSGGYQLQRQEGITFFEPLQ